MSGGMEDVPSGKTGKGGIGRNCDILGRKRRITGHRKGKGKENTVREKGGKL